MSTRCQIKVVGLDARLYKHYDGYPEGVMPILKSFLEKFKKVSPWDPAYLLARMTQHFCNNTDKDRAGNSAELNMLGYGIDSITHGDIEYLYTIHENFTVTYKHIDG